MRLFQLPPGGRRALHTRVRCRQVPSAGVG
uniref:Uncharacterized protein n=1 Tax=Mesocestoides corti TaxID=53468 RepID=A0A5K3G2T2_MESCO